MKFVKHSGMVLAAMGVLTFGAMNDAKAAPATVIKDGGCYLSAADSGLDNDLTTTEDHSVVNSGGNSVLKCHFDIPEADRPARALVNQDFPCNTYLGLTYNSKVVSSPGGQATLTCQVKKP